MDSSPGLSDNRTGKVLGPLRTVDLSPGKTSSGEAAKERRGWVLQCAWGTDAGHLGHLSPPSTCTVDVGRIQPFEHRWMVRVRERRLSQGDPGKAV